MRRRNFLRLDANTAIDGVLAAYGPTTAPVAPASAPQLQPQARTVLGWSQLALQALLTAWPGTSGAARTLAMLHACMYNAWAAYDDDARQTLHGVAVRLPRAERSAASKASAMSHAACRVLVDRFMPQQALFMRQMASLGLDPADASGQLSPAGIGRIQAAAMLDRYPRDAGATAAPPDPAGSPGERPAPGHWFRLARYVSARDDHDDDQDVLLYFVLATALAEGGEAAVGQACMHGACAAAAAEVLRSFTGSDRLGGGGIRRAGCAVFEPGWTTFSEAAEQAGPARIGAGIGTGIGAGTGRYAAGLELGRKIGAQVFDQARRSWQGKR